jgi:hypothetical protein
MKNTPITSRVNKGQASKTKEPLLNVGPAGVNGNNKTRDIKSPATKRGYAMSSPFKKTGDKDKKNTNPGIDPPKKKKASTSNTVIGDNKEVKVQTVLKTDGVGDSIIKGTEGTAAKDGALKGQRKGAKLSDKGWTDYLKNELPERKADRHAEDVKLGIREEGTKAVAATEDVVVKGSGPKEETSEIVLKKAYQGDGQASHERRKNIRDAKNLGKQGKQVEMKQARSDWRNKTSAEKKEAGGRHKFMKSKRKGANDTKNKYVGSVVADEKINRTNQSKQNIGANSTKSVQGNDVNQTQSDVADQTTIKGKPVEKKVDYKAVFGGMLDKMEKTPTGSTPPPVDKTDDLSPDAAAQKASSGFFKKKSPMKMKYFK